jgi:4-diphosphocytidyl-2-C-methyl-D-erythritol kinase
MPPDTLTIPCPAKVNLALSVGAPDAETGMHPICSWMVAVGFGDTLKLSRSTGCDSSYEILIADDAPPVPPGQRIDWPIESDLAFRAHGVVQQHVGQDLPINMELIKRIPSGAGLGGGSSDAAGMLVGLDRLFALELSDRALFGLGMRLGSDVGFLVGAQLGVRSALVSGVGDTIGDARLPDALHLVLIFPAMKCATAEVYRCFDGLHPSARLDPGRVRSLVDMAPLPADGPFNDLAEAAFEVAPGLREIHRKLCDVVGVPVHVSGSGASMFVVAGSSDEAERLRERIVECVGVSAVVM